VPGSVPVPVPVPVLVQERVWVLARVLVLVLVLVRAPGSVPEMARVRAHCPPAAPACRPTIRRKRSSTTTSASC